jgi:hypothetical protein
VLVETVLRISQVQIEQRGVAPGLGQDGRGGNGVDQVVATDDGKAADCGRRTPVAVD